MAPGKRRITIWLFSVAVIVLAFITPWKGINNILGADILSSNIAMKKKLLLFLACVLATGSSFAQIIPKVVVPNFGDAYSKTVKQLESGNLKVDYKAFRESFIESKQFKIAESKAKLMDSLEKMMFVELEKSNYPNIIRITKQMLSIDYTNMMAHKILRQTYTFAGDTISARRYHDIQFGLLNSIVKGGNGKTCETGWPVIQLSEERFILKMLDAKVQQQSIVNKGGLCDKMDVIVDGKKKTYYFETSIISKAHEPKGAK